MDGGNGNGAQSRSAVAEHLPLDRLLRQDVIDWDAVLARIQHRDQGYFEDEIIDAYSVRTLDYFGIYERRRSPAHVCVEQGAPLEVLRALHDAAPYLFAESDPSPLEVACHAAAPDATIRLLLNFARAVYDEGYGGFEGGHYCDQYIPDEPAQPLYFVNTLGPKFFDSRILQLLLQEYPQGVTIRNCAGFDMRSGIDILVSPIQGTIIVFIGDPNLFDFVDERQYWECLQLLLKASEYGTIRDGNLIGKNFRPYHALIRFILESSLPEALVDFSNDKDRANLISLLQFVAGKVGSDVKERDDHGLLPLHIVVGKPSGTAGLPAREDVMSAIVGIHQDAAIVPDAHGRIPLHNAMENGWQCVSLIQASLPTLGIKDLVTGFFPFQIAACAFSSKPLDDICVGFGAESNDDDGLSHLTNIFNSLRLDPAVIDRGVKEARRELKSFELIYILLRANPSLVVKSDLRSSRYVQANGGGSRKRKDREA